MGLTRFFRLPRLPPLKGFHFPTFPRAQRLHLIISLALRIAIIAAMISATLAEKWLTLFIATVALLLTFLPAIIERNAKLYIPLEFELIMNSFVYASLFLGEIHEWYTRFWWWDLFLHTISGIMFGFIGFLLIYIMNQESKVRLSPSFIALFTCSFAITIGVVWEIVEFTADSTLGTNMQKSGLLDTMADLIVDLFGGIVVSVFGYLYVKRKKLFFFNRIMSRFIEKNPKIFDEFSNG
ncbi:hypothetical protein J4464_00925 [Candidatus Woesearchaeota archaeon]|nr:hypothetical protein [Candidatus Woesearchaeota archaeon]